MTHYLLIHDVKVYPESQDEWIEMWRDLRSRACGEVEWLHSFYEPESRRMYCQWSAPDLDAIMACIEGKVLETAPVIATSEIVLFDVAWLDEKD